MKQAVIEAEKNAIALALESFFKNCRPEKELKRYQNIYVIGDDNFICDYFISALNGVAFKSVCYVSAKDDSDYRLNTLNSQNISVISAEDFNNIKTDKNLVFFFADTNAPQSKDGLPASLKAVENLLSAKKNSRCVVTVFLPKIEPFPGEVTSLAERELNFFMEKVCDENRELQYYLQIEKICRGFVRDGNLDITLLRFDNVFAPDRFHTPSFDLEKIVSDAVKTGKITITDEDESLVTTATYIRNACCAVFASAFKGLKGHIYNVAYDTVTISDIKRHIFNGYKDKFSLSANLSGKAKKNYNALNNLVFSKLNIESVIPFKDAVGCTVAFLAGYHCPDISESNR